MKPEFICKLGRYRSLSRLRAYYDSKQYDGRPDFFTGRGASAEVVPLRERKPCVIYPFGRAVTGQVARFTFGEGRFPSMTIPPQRLYGGATVEPDDASDLETGIAALVEHCGVRPIMTALMKRALACGTSVAIFWIANGSIEAELPHAQDCLPEFEGGRPGAPLAKLTWCYKFEKDVDGERGPERKKFWFRREVDAKAYYEWEPVAVDANKPTVDWGAPTVTPHLWGFVPALWVRNLDTIGNSDIDGVSIYDDLFDEIDALNFALSQRHRGITFFGTPQPYETGVEEDAAPEATGRKLKGYNNGRPSKTEDARKMAPDQIWRYAGEKVTVGLLETTGKAFEVATLHVEDIRSRMLESISVVLANADQFIKNGGDMNAKFLVLAYAPMIALVGELREVTWWPALRSVVSMMVRMVTALRGQGLCIPNMEALATVAARFNVDTEVGPLWMFPQITPVWGAFFEPTEDEIGKAVDTATKAKNGGLIQEKTAVQYVATHFGVADPQAELEELQKRASAGDDDSEDVAADANDHELEQGAQCN
jgi:hypothetical protein